MSDKSDASVSPIVHKGKRKAPLLTDSDAESDSSVSDIDVTVLRRSGKRKNRIGESDSDSSIEKPRKLKRIPRVTSDSESSSSDESDIVKTKKPARVVSDDSNNSDSDSDVSGASDNGFEDNTSDEWESDWISESEIDQSQTVNNNENKDCAEPAASTSYNLGNISDSSDGESEKCPICLLSFNTQEVGTPETCDHSFCADCIQEWSKNVNTCPVDRQTFTLILVRKRYNGKVIRTVPVDVRRPSVDELIQEDPTFCEICGMSDREDRLLLCDGCDLGFHLECLDPPMDTVPIEEWFCSTCYEDFPQQPQRGNRGEHRLMPRTMQSERIRATIATNRNNSAFNADQQSVSSGFEDVAVPGTSRTSSARNRSRSTAPTRKNKHKKRRRTYKKKKRASYTVTYDICEVTGEKIVIKKKLKARKSKKRTKRKVKRSTRRVVKPKTVKKRLAYQLGMCPPKKAGLAVPEVKVKSNGSNIGNIGYQRSQAGIPTLHLFGQRDQLDYFSESDDETTVSGGGGMGILTQIRISTGDMGAMRRAARRKAAVLSPVSVNSVDILSSILDSQEKLHSKNSVISVSRDGTLHIEQNERQRLEKNNNDIVKPNNDIISQTSPIDISSSGEIETTQAPMFPGRGGGGNRQPYGFHNRGGYRGGDNRYDGGSGGNYNHFQGGGQRGRGGYGQNMYNQRDNNFGGGYMNFHHHGGPPPPFRGRGGPRFPTRRPQLHQQQPQVVTEREEPVELNLDEPMEQTVSEDQVRQQEEDVDIYSDIEAGTPVPDDEVTTNKPVGEPEPTLVSQAYNNSGTDDDSGSELVIDDTVKDTDKYDPTQPSADTDSNSEPPVTLNEPEPPKEITNVSIPEEKPEEPEQKIENTEVETQKLTSFSTEAVNEAVQQVIQEHLNIPSKTIDNDNDDDDDALDDDDCPNFSIYSSTSIDIAKSTEISVDIPKQNDNIENQNEPDSEMKTAPQFESTIKDPGWESGDEWDAPEAETNQETLDKSDAEQIPSPAEPNIPDEKDEAVEADDAKEDEASPQLEEEKDDLEDEPQTVEPDNKLEETDEEETETDKPEDKPETSEIIKSVEDDDKHEDGDQSPKPDGITVETDQIPVAESTTPPLDALPSIPLPEETEQDKEKVSAPVKIAFTPGKKYQPENSKKERVLQLYDDSDWEEWESKNEVEKSEKSAESTENVTTELDKLTEAISEEERSYTPCLDEREPVKGQFSDEERNIGAGIGGMDTELISDEERNEFDESHDMKTISDGDALEINAKESELDMTRPEDYEEGEIIEKLGAKKAQDTPPEKPKPSGSEDDKSKKRVKKKTDKEPEKPKAKETDKQAKKPEFKKISKSNKDRNYRDKEKARSKSKERKDKENKENRKEDRKKKERKRDLERYNVRSIIAEKPKKDQFGRDINKSPSRSSRSASPRRSRSHSWNRAKRRRRRSRSVRRSRSRSGSRGHTPRSRSRGKSLRRSRSFRRSRSPRRSRSKSFRRSRSPRNKRHRLEYRSSSRDRDRSRRYRDRSRRRSTERLRSKKKNRSLSRTRLRSRTPSLSKHRIRGEWARSVDEPRRQSYTREWTPSWSRSPTPPRPVPRHNLPQSMSPSWTPPLIEKGPVQPENLTVILTNEVNKTKKKEKKKKGEKKSKDEYRKRKRGDRTPPPSKEVFASGDNILVSVSFNKTSEENAVPTREVTGVKRKRDETAKKKKDKVGEKKKKRAKSPRTKKKNKEIANMKPVAIIDLDRSPFKEITPSPKDIIVLSDSDNCEKEDETMGHHDMMQEELMSLSAQIQEDSAPQSPTANYLNSTGPKTPPEPQIKFLLTSKQTQLRQINNPLHDPNDENEPDIDPQEELEHRLDDVLHKGPNTPPEPPSSPPSSPDAYDPFDPTKSRSPTPEPPPASQPINSAMNTPDKTESDGDLADLAVGPLESSQKSTASLIETTEKRSGSLDRTKRLSSSPERTSQTLTPPVSSSDQPVESSDSNKNDTGDKNTKSPERNSIGVVINQQVQPQFPAVVKPIIPTPSIITSTPAVPTAALPRTNLFSTPSSVSGTPRIPASVPQRIILPTPAKSSPAKMSPLKTSPSKPPIKSTPIKPMPSKTMISKLPVPNMKPITPVRKGPQTKAANRNVGQNGNEIIDVDLDFESPYSPGSSDYEDLFEPPTESTKNNNSSRANTKNTKSPAKQNTFDTLFGSSPVFRSQNNKSKSKTNAAKIPVKMNKKSTPTKAGTKTVGVKIDEDNLKILDDLPNSAVEMQVKDKFLKKLNRQERVVEEVKLVLKPHYNKKHVTKEQYKDILRRAVPKICHNRSGEINPKKIQNLIEAYVRKARHAKKAATGGANTNSGATAQQPKPFLRK